jgi:hypothetical protein
VLVLVVLCVLVWVLVVLAAVSVSAGPLATETVLVEDPPQPVTSAAQAKPAASTPPSRASRLAGVNRCIATEYSPPPAPLLAGC